MTGSLRALAGDTLRANLMRFTRTPTSGAAIGALSTAVLQSSSATTVAAVGFVGAGLMSFHNALGIIFGANLGTTLTGWMVALIGFKLQLGMLALPLILLGALIKLFASGRTASAGLVLAGFGLIFVGISTLQAGMSGLDSLIDFSRLPPDTLIGRLQLVALGVAFTLITQSSSAGVAATLSTLFAGLIQWEQAAALIIGMDIGTTVTALMASLGGSLGARRTGLSHVIYNLATGLVALLLITPYRAAIEALQPGLIQAEAELALVGFHTLFNLIGVLLVLPVARQFAHLVENLLRETPSPYTHELRSDLLKSPQQALDAIRQSTLLEYRALLNHLYNLLTAGSTHSNLPALQIALDDTHRYLDRVIAQTPDETAQLTAMLHMLDHLQRLHERCEEEEDRAVTARSCRELTEIYTILSHTLPPIEQSIDKEQWHESEVRAQHCQAEIDKLAETYRASVASAIAEGSLSVPEGTRRLEAIRWMRRVSHHISRINHHLKEGIRPSLEPY